MRAGSLILALMASIGLLSPRPVLASKILLISSGDTSNDAAIQSVLQSYGDSVTIGPTYNTFTGSGLSGYDAVFLNPSYTPNASVNWTPMTAQPDMPASGQQALLDFVNQGGGLVTGATVAQMLQHDMGDLRTLRLAQALPFNSLSEDTGNSPITFTSLTSDPRLNAGLPSTFSFTAGGYFTEHHLTPVPNATGFFATNQWTAAFGGTPGYGLVGWNYGAGRILGLSTFSDNTALSNATYDRMLANAFDWATRADGSPPPPAAQAPEPTSLMVFIAAGLGLLDVSRSRRRRASE
jgi:hypothetical protein